MTTIFGFLCAWLLCGSIYSYKLLFDNDNLKIKTNRYINTIVKVQKCVICDWELCSHINRQTYTFYKKVIISVPIIRNKTFNEWNRGY